MLAEKIEKSGANVYLVNTDWNGKKYTFAVNGQSGKIVGDLPLDKGAFWKWFFGIFAGVTAVCYLLQWLLAL